jgi:hypothetical protein
VGAGFVEVGAYVGAGFDVAKGIVCDGQRICGSASGDDGLQAIERVVGAGFRERRLEQSLVCSGFEISYPVVAELIGG